MCINYVLKSPILGISGFPSVGVHAGLAPSSGCTFRRPLKACGRASGARLKRASIYVVASWRCVFRCIIYTHIYIYTVCGDLKQLTAATEEVSAGRLSPDELLSPPCSSKIPKMTVLCPSLLQLSVLLLSLSDWLTPLALSFTLGAQGGWFGCRASVNTVAGSAHFPPRSLLQSVCS